MVIALRTDGDCLTRGNRACAGMETYQIENILIHTVPQCRKSTHAIDPRLNQTTTMTIISHLLRMNHTKIALPPLSLLQARPVSSDPHRTPRRSEANWPTRSATLSFLLLVQVGEPGLYCALGPKTGDV